MQMVRAHPEVDAGVLRELYSRRRMSAREISAETGLSVQTVWRRLAEYGIPTHRETIPTEVEGDD